MRTFFHLSFVLALAVTCAVSARAQDVPPPARVERPYRGLFGGGVGDAEQLLMVGVKGGIGYDNTTEGSNTVIAGSTPISIAPFWFSEGGAALRYTLSREKVSLGASMATLGRFDRNDLSPVIHADTFGLGLSFNPTASSEIAVGGSLSRQPYVLLTAAPGDVSTSSDIISSSDLGLTVPVPPEYAASSEHYRAVTTSVTAQQHLSPRIALYGSYLFTQSQFPPGFADFDMQSGSGGLRWEFAKGLSLRGEYGRTQSRYHLPDGSVQYIDGKTLNGGVEFDRALSVSRRTRLSFSTGTAVFQYGNHTEYRLTGYVRLSREFQRTWNLSTGYSRTASTVNTLLAPVASDAVDVAVSGLPTRRIMLRVDTGAEHGRVGLTSTGSPYWTYFGYAQIGYAINRHLQAGAEYRGYHYQFESVVTAPLGVPPILNRQTLRAYITVWDPLVYRKRRPHAAR